MRTLVFILFAFFSFLVVEPARAIAVDEDILENPDDEARAIELMKEIRCLKCQNQSIFDSEAGIAKDLRKIVREGVAAGDSEQDIKALLVASYGDWVLLKPPFNIRTYLLWLAPLFFLVLGVLLAMTKFRKKQAEIKDKPLSVAEKARLKKLLSRGGKR